MSSHFTKYVSVVLDVALDKALDYGVPAELVDRVQCGARVDVPVRGYKRSGYVIEVKETASFARIQPIIDASAEIIINDELFELALWLAQYYCTPLYKVLQTIIPSSIRSEMKPKEQLFVMRAQPKEQLKLFCEQLRNTQSPQAAVLDVMLKVTKGILLSELLEQTKGSRSPVDTLVKKGYLAIDIVRIDRSPLIDEEYFQTNRKALNEEQAAALKKISDSLEQQRFETHLLHGVTGSGKTEVYLQAIEQALKLDKGTLMLVPEISLTTQTIERFRSRFKGEIAILHHRLSHGERCDAWHKIQQGEARIVIGARSAVFSPIKNLGLVIVDEEHEHSYKQSDEMPCYHARDVAVMRGKMTKSTVILGSATPCLESYHNVQKGKYTLSMLGNRADAASMPKVTIVDMKVEYERNKGYTNFSDLLLRGIKERYAQGEQTILFLNRRGYHTTLFCPQCCSGVRCKHCDIAMTYHKGDNALACHLCGFTLSPPPTACPSCRSPNPMKFQGVGTEQIEKALHAIIPGIRTLRMDADTTRHKGSHQKLFRAFGTGKADVLIGTQMIAKGLHFPSVTLVGVLNSDSSLNIPDFRASETAFQLITQVSGRAGRGSLAGEVIIQTCMPDNHTIQMASKQNYVEFFHEEMSSRQIFCYPPFTQMAKISFSGTDAAKTCHAAEQMRQHLISCLKDSAYEVNAVIPAGYAKVKDKYRFQFLVRGPAILTINNAIKTVQQQCVFPKEIKVRIDINPTSTFF